MHSLHWLETTLFHTMPLSMKYITFFLLLWKIDSSIQSMCNDLVRCKCNCPFFTSVLVDAKIDGCPQVSICDNRYVWQETEIGSLYILSPCIHRLCGGTYSTGGQWEAVILTCKTDYVSCAVSELENIVNEALNNTKVN